MKLFSLRLTTLKSKLYAIVFVSFVVRVMAFFALPNTPSALGPDEGTYARAANWTALGKPATEFPDYGASLYTSGRSLLLPAAFFNNIGFSPLNSVRLISSLYGLLTLILIVFILLRIIDTRHEVENFVSKNQKKVLILLTIFAFLPSRLVWSVLGFREAAMEFWVLIVFSIV